MLAFFCLIMIRNRLGRQLERHSDSGWHWHAGTMAVTLSLMIADSDPIMMIRGNGGPLNVTANPDAQARTVTLAANTAPKAL